MWLFALFVIVPIVEIGLFIQVGGWLGLWPTLLIVVVTAILGTYLVRQQGALALSRLSQSFSQLSDPSEPLAHGAMILFSGALLLTPGFFTDAVGFLLLVPSFRSIMFRELKKRVKVQQFSMGGQQGFHREDPRSTNMGQTIDGEYEDSEASKNEELGNSGWTRH